MTNRFQTLEQIAQDLNAKTEQLTTATGDVLKRISAPVKIESKHIPNKQEMRRNNAFNAWNKFNTEEQINDQS